ncbi:hypothetical protein [Alteromonas flava]|uniref:hypothetical protein n=1 Tax=Alteromonas flava TaxID=2048003 RepID=UPI000C291C6F|nr:hypothetical protein [Alteromonas flava]
MIKEPIHGRYQLHLSGVRLICDYAEGFNLPGVKRITNDMLQATTHLSSWVLLQRPEASAGITQEAIPAMMQGYVQLQNAGCKAVAIVDRSIFVHAGIPYHPRELIIPIRIEQNETKLIQWLDEIEVGIATTAQPSNDPKLYSSR